MNEQDRKFVEGMRSRGDEDKNIYNLLGIIDDLDDELTEIVEKGKPRDELRQIENRIVHAAVQVVDADTYKHPVLSREQAVTESVAELHDAVNAWHNIQTADISLAEASKEINND